MYDIWNIKNLYPAMDLNIVFTHIIIVGVVDNIL